MIRLALLGLLACMASMGEGLGVEVEDVTGRQLEAALETENLLGVMFYSKNCKTCDRVLSVLERVGEEVATNGITLVRVNDKKAAKTHAIRNFPALSLFKMGEALHYEGDLTDADAILDFLSSPEALDVPGQIEDVTASQLEVLVQHQNFVAVFFYTGNKESSEVLNGLEKVDDYCDKLEISLVKINDLELVTEYNLGELPALVYYRHSIPILYEGDLTAEDDILEWLIQNRSSGDEDDVIEEVEFKSLEAMVSAVENIAVLFYNAKSTKMDQILESVETIDDDCDTRGVHFVKISDPAAAYHYGISTLPTLVYFKNSVPNLFDGELLDDEGVLQWLLTHLESAEIEEVSNSMLGRLIRDSRNIVVIFCKYIAYAIIALTHTCYLIKNYAPDELKKFLPPQNVRGMASET
eukprot:GFUD01015796.1.p1 GENE.GFUD01015796.1~~GFUD01015796.1.p1  ORF type:complete len:410 (+),score=89.91 GFUD01015796.1:98-1327(+)